MKKKKVQKLQLNRETLRRLGGELAAVHGRGGDTEDTGCAGEATETCAISGCPECVTLRGPNCHDEMPAEKPIGE